MLRQSTSLPARIAARKNFPGLQVHASSTINYNADDLKDSNSKPKAILYQILALGLAGAGIGLLAYPSKAIELGFSATPTLLIQGLVRILGSVHIASLCAEVQTNQIIKFTFLDNEWFYILSAKKQVCWNVFSGTQIYKYGIFNSITFHTYLTN